MSKTLMNIAGRTGLSDRVIPVRAGTERSWERPGSPQEDPGWKSGKSILKISLCGLLSLFAAVHPALAQNTLSAWGRNDNGQLGNGTAPTPSNRPVTVSGMTGVVATGGGGDLGLAVKNDGTAWAWGYNQTGQLGNGTTINSSVPVMVTNSTGTFAAVAGGGLYSLGLKSDGTVWGWGYNVAGSLGNGLGVNSSVPVQAIGVIGATAIAAGYYHSLALKNDGTVWAWGNNQVGSVGPGLSTHVHTPVQLSGLTGILAIAAGEWHSMALKNDGTVWTWGYNLKSQLGYASPLISPTPSQVPGLSGVTAISAGGIGFHSLALKSDGTVVAWGYNSNGQLGNGTTTDSLTPVPVSGLTNVIAIAAGARHSIALRSDRRVWTWGYNALGQLGNCSYDDSNTPVAAWGIGGVVAISGGYHNTYAIGNPPSTALCGSDDTAPVITPSVVGPTGTNGWYTGAVTVTWNTSDPETGIASSTGCVPTILTTGATLTCSATNGAGLSSSIPVTIKIDQTPPIITPTVTGQLGSNGWYTGPVTVSWSVADPQSGITSSSGCAQTTLTADTPGTTLTCSAINGAGLSNPVPLTIKIDTSRPLI